MKIHLFLILSLFTTVAWAGGISSVGPIGPDAQAKQAFEASAEVQNSIQKLEVDDYVEDTTKGSNNFLGLTNCRPPFNGATFIACDRTYLFIRIFKSSGDLIVVGAKVVMTANGFDVQAFQK